jgi:hypothetical protein
MRNSTTWHGTEEELSALVSAVDNHCTCLMGECAAHALLLGDQAVLDRLIFVRRIADCLRREEGLTAHAVTHAH